MRPSANASSNGVPTGMSSVATSIVTGSTDAAARSSAPPTYRTRPSPDASATTAAMATTVILFMTRRASVGRRSTWTSSILGRRRRLLPQHEGVHRLLAGSRPGTSPSRCSTPSPSAGASRSMSSDQVSSASPSDGEGAAPPAAATSQAHAASVVRIERAGTEQLRRAERVGEQQALHPLVVVQAAERSLQVAHAPARLSRLDVGEDTPIQLAEVLGEQGADGAEPRARDPRLHDLACDRGRAGPGRRPCGSRRGAAAAGGGGRAAATGAPRQRAAPAGPPTRGR